MEGALYFDGANFNALNFSYNDPLSFSCAFFSPLSPNPEKVYVNQEGICRASFSVRHDFKTDNYPSPFMNF